MVCDRISAGTSNLSKEQATKTNTPFELAFLLVIYVEEIKLAAAIREILGDAYEQTAQDRCAKRIEEEKQTWASRPGEYQLHRRNRSALARVPCPVLANDA